MVALPQRRALQVPRGEPFPERSCETRVTRTLGRVGPSSTAPSRPAEDPYRTTADASALLDGETKATDATGITS